MKIIVNVVLYVVLLIAILAVGAAASDPVSWRNWAGAGVFVLIVAAVLRLDRPRRSRRGK